MTPNGLQRLRVFLGSVYKGLHHNRGHNHSQPQGKPESSGGYPHKQRKNIQIPCIRSLEPGASRLWRLSRHTIASPHQIQNEGSPSGANAKSKRP